MVFFCPFHIAGIHRRGEITGSVLFVILHVVIPPKYNSCINGSDFKAGFSSCLRFSHRLRFDFTGPGHRRSFLPLSHHLRLAFAEKPRVLNTYPDLPANRRKVSYRNCPASAGVQFFSSYRSSDFAFSSSSLG